MMKKILLFLIIGLSVCKVANGADPNVFTSKQVGTNPVNGYYLTTDGSKSSWSPVSGVGLVTSTDPLMASYFVATSTKRNVLEGNLWVNGSKWSQFQSPVAIGVDTAYMPGYEDLTTERLFIFGSTTAETMDRLSPTFQIKSHDRDGNIDFWVRDNSTVGIGRGLEGTVGGSTLNIFGDMTVMASSSKTTTLGTEMITNGTFDTDITGWTDSGSNSYWDNSVQAFGTPDLELYSAGSDASGSLTNLTGTVIDGEAYALYYDFTAMNSGTMNVSIDGSNMYCQPSMVCYFVAPVSGASTGEVSFDYSIVADYAEYLDNVSLKHLENGYPADISINYNEQGGVNDIGAGITIGRQGENNLAFGRLSFLHNYDGTDNLAYGNEALYSAMSANNNLAIGSQALKELTIGDANLAIGYLALTNLRNSSYNTAIGGYSQTSNLTGTYNTSIGNSSLYNLTSGYDNVAIGYSTLYNLTDGYLNTFIGDGSGYNVNGSQNIGIGFNTLRGASGMTGSNNVGIGSSALYSVTSAGLNNAVGYQALYNATDGSQNNAFGYQTLYSDTTGDLNSAFGTQAMFYNTDGEYNVAMGVQSLYTATSSDKSIAIGSYAGKYETANQRFYVNSIDRTNITGDRTKSLMYGVMDTDETKQTLAINASTTINTGFTVATTSARSAFNIDTYGINDTKYGIYCEIYVADSTATQSIPSGTTYTKSTDFASSTLTKSRYCNPSPTNSNITITKAGKYLVTGQISVTSATPNIVLKATVFRDGVEQGQVHGSTYLPAGAIETIPFVGIVTATSTSVFDVRYRHDNGSAVTITTEYSNLNFIYIGEAQ